MNEEQFETILSDISDGTPVDWGDIGRLAPTREYEGLIRNLRVIANVAQLAREPVKPAPDDVLPFETWGPLKLLEKIGEGSFGIVYRAWDAQLHRQVALKLLKRRFLRDDRWQARFLNEARLMARVEHPHVVRIYGAESHDGRPGLWMELVGGVSLERRVIEQGPLEVEDVLRIGTELAEALSAVHAAHVLHQDVKPHNIMIDAVGRLVLMDFGAGRPRGGSTEALAGTPLYMAPEVFEGREPTPRSDLYSLGVVLYYLATGEHPVIGDTASQVIRGHLEQNRRPVGDLRSDLPPRFIQVIDRATDPDPGRRFESAAEMGAALAEARNRREDLPAPPPLDRRRNRGLILAVAGAAVMVLLALALTTTTRRTAVPASGSLTANARFLGVADGAARILETGDLITPGHQLEISLELSKEAYVYVLNADNSGNTVVMFPMAGAGGINPLAAGKTHRLPGAINGKPSGWTLSDTRGVENFLIVASPGRLDDFERALDAVPTVDLVGGLSIKPISSEVLAVLTRSVTGVAPLPEGDPGPDLFEVARNRARTTGGGPDNVWLYELHLRNSGS